MAALTPETVRQLATLKAMLDEASVYARRAVAHQRITAVVLLDGVIERATHLVGTDQGVKVSQKLEDFLSNVVGELRTAGSPVATSLGDVRQLHRARNNAQHEGLAPDREQVPRWASLVSAFVRELIDKRFGVDIDRVAVTDAVVDEELRRTLEQSSAHLASGSYDCAVETAELAVTLSRKRWERLRGYRRPLFATGDLSRGFERMINEHLLPVTKLVSLLPFAPSTSEAQWFLRLQDERSHVLDRDDAERAFAFAVDWVIAYEVAATSWVPDRQARHDRASRLTRRGDECAHIESVVSVTPDGDDHFSVRLRLAGLPADEDFDEWAHQWRVDLHRAFGDEQPWAHFNQDGTLQVTVGGGDDAERVLQVVRDTLATADERLAGARSELSLRVAAEKERSEEYAQAFSSAGAPPTWLKAVALRSDSGMGDELYLTVADEELSGGSIGVSHDALATLLRDEPELSQAYTTGDGGISVQPILDPADLHLVLSRVNEEVATERSRLQAESDEKRRRTEELKAKLSQALHPNHAADVHDA